MVMVVGSWLFWDGGSAGLGWWVGPAIPIPGQVSFSYSSVDAAAAAGGCKLLVSGAGGCFFFFFFFIFSFQGYMPLVILVKISSIQLSEPAPRKPASQPASSQHCELS